MGRVYTPTVPNDDAGKTVMVVEDDEDIRDSVRDILEGEGYQVCTAANGQEALAALLRAARPCLILLDLMMPVMDGQQFLARLRSQPSFADIPVVVVSAISNAAPAAEDFIKKPFDADVLIKAVKKYCDCA